MSLDSDIVLSDLQFTLIPVILVLGAIVLGIVFLIIIVILIGRRVSINLKPGGAVTLTLASILFLSGFWCMMLSPTVTDHKTEDEFCGPISIDALLLLVHPLNVKEGDTLTVDLNFFATVAEPYLFVTKIYDPDSAVVWSETNTTHVHFRMKAIKSGRYRVEVGNPYPETIECYAQITVGTDITYRHLEPLGSWLALISLPIFGLGIWASGILEKLDRSILRRAIDESR